MATDGLFRLMAPAWDWPKHIPHLLAPVWLRSTEENTNCDLVMRKNNACFLSVAAGRSGLGREIR